MAKPDYICKECTYRRDTQGRVKCVAEARRELVCNTKSMYRSVSARSAGCLSKDGTRCKYFEKKKI